MTNRDKSSKLKIYENDNRNENLLYSENGVDGFLSAAHLLKDNNRIEKFSTGSSSLDNILGGGIEIGSITQFYGGPGSGKSQICLTACALIQKNYNSFYVDTESKFRPERIEQIAEERGRMSHDILKNIYTSNPINSQEMEASIEQILQFRGSNGVFKLLIIDSLINHLRIEYPGRSQLPLRQQKINLLMGKLQKIAQEKKIAVIITNHIQADPTPNFSSYDVVPTGGNIINYASTHIVRLRKTSDYTNASLIKSNYLASNESYFTINKKGIDDI